MAASVPSSRAPWLTIVWMLLAVGAVVAVASVDEEREAAAALADFGEQQHALAHALLAAALLATPPGAPGAQVDAGGLLAHLQIPSGHRRLLVKLPRASGFVDPRGQPVPPSAAVSAVQRAFEQGSDTLILSREESASLGMARRTSAVGLTRALLAGQGEVGLALVTGAERDRDRAHRAQWRVLAAIGIAVALVGTFGGLAMRRQRQELTLAAQLAGDERLNRLDRSAVMLTLAAGLAHEIGTPLAVIQGRAEQLRLRSGLDERTASSLATISTQVQHIQEVVQGFLHLARGGSMSLQSASPAEVMASAQALVEHRFESAGVRLLVQPSMPSGQAAPPIRCNRLLLEHALTNLLLNARDACAAGGTVRLTLEPAAARPEGEPAVERLAMVVTDDGEGIPPELASRVTEAFFSTKPEGKGTGLGLAIATEIAKLHHGTLTLSPHAPRGTRVAIEVPHG